MNIMELGAIGEFVGAIAVVTTLIYLATQIRQNTRAMRAETINAVTSNVQNEMATSLLNPAVATALAKSVSTPHDLTDTEIVHLRGRLISAMMSRQNEYFLHQQGLLDDEIWESLNYAIRVNLGTPWSRRWWSQVGRNAFAVSFVTYVESQLEKQDPANDGIEEEHRALRVEPNREQSE